MSDATMREQLARVRELLFPKSGGLGCWKKNRYDTEDHAAAVCRLRQKDEPARLYCYRCPVCGGWHLTKLRPPEWKGD